MGLGRKPKSIKLTSAIYPEQENGQVVGSNVDALTKYALMNPQKLADIGKYVEKRVQKALSKKQYGFVKVSLDIFNAIIQSCTANLLTFYAPYVVSSLQDIFKHEKKLSTASLSPEMMNTLYEMKLNATDTFAKFAKQRYNNNVIEYSDLSFIFEYFVDMCTYESQDKEKRRRMRICGLKGFYTYITTAEDLDSFVAKYIDIERQTRFIHCILSNLLEYIKEAEGVESPKRVADEEFKSVRKLASACLMELAKSPSPITIHSLLTAVISFLDSMNVWTNEAFANECIKAISVKPQHNQVVISQLLSHLDTFVNDADVETKISIVQTLMFFFEGIAKGPTGLAMVEVLIPLVGQLLIASKSKDANAEKLQTGIIKCIGIVGKRVTDPSEKLEAMAYIIDRTKSNTEATTLLLQSVLQIALHLNQLPASRHLPQKVIQPLLNFSLSEVPEIRLTIQQIFQSLLKATQKGGLNSSSIDLNETKKRNKAIRLSLYKQALLENNNPENLLTIYETFCCLFERNQAKELQYSLPIMFKLEDLVEQKVMEPHLSRALHSIIVAYLLQAAKALDCKAIPEMLNEQVIEAEEETSEISSVFIYYNGLLSLRKKVFKKKLIKKSVHVQKIIDKVAIAKAFAELPNVIKEFGSNVDLVQLFTRDIPAEDIDTKDIKLSSMTESKERSPALEAPQISKMRSDTLIAPPVSIIAPQITAESFTKLFEVERNKASPEFIPIPTTTKSRKKTLPVAPERKSTIKKERTATLENPPQCLSFASEVAFRTRQANEKAAAINYIFDLFPKGDTDNFQVMERSSILDMDFPSLSHVTLVDEPY